MPTIAQHIAARDDHDLQQRLVAAAEMNGVADPVRWVNENIGRLVSAQVGDSCLTDVHAYAVGQKAEHVLSAGADPAYVTDQLLKAAVRKVHGDPE